MGSRLFAAICFVASTFAAPFINDTGLLTPEYFAVADKNADGKIDFDEFLHTDQEYINAMMQRFAKLDKDGSDSLDLNEFTTVSEADKNRYFVDVIESSSEDEPVIVLRGTVKDDLEIDSADSDSEESLKNIFDSDDGIENDEVAELKRKKTTTVRPAKNFYAAFDEYDVDGDGKLIDNELINYIQEYFEMALKRSAHKIIERYDANKDGGLDKQEVMDLLEDSPSDLVEPLAGSEEYDYVHDGDENDYGFAADSIVSDRH